nr:hypothetical protein [Pseudofrankia asymbiotica]
MALTFLPVMDSPPRHSIPARLSYPNALTAGARAERPCGGDALGRAIDRTWTRSVIHVPSRTVQERLLGGAEVFDAAVEVVDEEFCWRSRRGEVAKVFQGLTQLGVSVEDSPTVTARPLAIGEFNCPEKPAHGGSLGVPNSYP